MKTLKFKTSVSCGGCVATITPHLNKISEITKWSVDTTSPLKILTVETTGINPDVIIETLKSVGYKAELISSE
ncbi:MAG: hypothetical protein A2X12_06365 [Bacteroidetes bacterium GWE2_29_8]|nr:MAG: hypothetical protein A2X12_06365 [Bacteroidetes bacterium GWE2_29_8]OFY15658.1 MAG: hypothetical protein A2X02_06495 [Bacteroidetes bacterium GWF2_29_10]